ncbi:MAG: methyltransferase domain-containing protein [Patescibacteria group bacterium]|nr:methyltransferase domain-containing protein [Patescibacteria group bacterium]
MSNNRAEELFWDVYARLYDDLAGLLPYRQEMDEIVNALERILASDDDPGAEAGVRSELTLLDAACGTGYMLDKLSQVTTGVRFVGVDRSKAMLKRASRRVQTCRPAKLLLDADLDGKLPFQDGSFDVVSSVNTLYALQDPDVFLTEIRRVLKPGGTVLIVNPWKPKLLPIWREHFATLAERRDEREYLRTALLMPSFLAITAINTVIARRAKGKVYHFLEPGELAHLVQANGFVIETLRYEIYAGTCCMIIARG